jgi:hypothetical protein
MPSIKPLQKNEKKEKLLQNLKKKKTAAEMQ